MAILGIDTLVYGVHDIKTSTRFFEDFGLRLIESTSEESRFELPEGSRVVLRPLDHPILPLSTIEGPGVREVIWGVDSARSVDKLARELGADRETRRDDEGTVHFVTDFGSGGRYAAAAALVVRRAARQIRSRPAPARLQGLSRGLSGLPRHAIAFVPQSLRAGRAGGAGRRGCGRPPSPHRCATAPESAARTGAPMRAGPGSTRRQEARSRAAA